MKFYKRKIFQIPILFIIYCILISNFTKFTGIITIIAGIGMLISLFYKKGYWKQKKGKFKILTSICAIVLILVGFITFVISLDSGSKNITSEKSKEQISQQKQEDEQKRLKAEQEAKQKQEEDKKKAELAAKQKAEEDAKQKAEQEKQAQAANNNSSSSVERDDTSDCSQGKVVICVKGKKYHNPGCGTIKQVLEYVTQSEAQSRGYTPCKRCH